MHLSAGDLLRAEQERPGSEFGSLIRRYIKEGTIVPMEVTVTLLENAMMDVMSRKGVRMFLIDGMCYVMWSLATTLSGLQVCIYVLVF